MTTPFRSGMPVARVMRSRVQTGARYDGIELLVGFGADVQVSVVPPNCPTAGRLPSGVLCSLLP